MSESRDLTISAYLNGTGQEFTQVFNGKLRDVIPKILKTEVFHLEAKIQGEIDDATANNNQETAQKLEKLLANLQNLIGETCVLAEDDITDDRFKLEDKKREFAQEVFQLTSGKRVDAARAEYLESKHSVSAFVQDSGNDREKHQVREIIAQEETFIHSTKPERIQAATHALEGISFQIKMRMPDFLVGMFEHLVEMRTSMNDQIQAKQLIENGKRLIASEAWDDLRQVNVRLWDLMPDDERSSDDMRIYTGIV